MESPSSSNTSGASSSGTKRKVVSPLVDARPLPRRKLSGSLPDLTDDDSLTVQLSKGKTVSLHQIIHATVTSPTFLQHLAESMKTILMPSITSAVEEAVKPLLERIKKQDVIISNLKEDVEQLKHEKDELYCQVDELTVGLDELEQYGRRNSLRFHNVPLASSQLDATDAIIVKIVNDNFRREETNVTICEDDINRSHIIGKINRAGKAQLICRFRNWKIKNKIYKAKSVLKNNPNKIFITEDLTKPRQELIQRLGQLRKSGDISSFWTMDGRVFVKESDFSPKTLISSHEDIDQFDHSI